MATNFNIKEIITKIICQMGTASYFSTINAFIMENGAMGTSTAGES